VLADGNEPTVTVVPTFSVPTIKTIETTIATTSSEATVSAKSSFQVALLSWIIVVIMLVVSILIIFRSDKNKKGGE